VRLEPGHAIPPTFAISSPLAERIRAAGSVRIRADIERDAPIETENVLAFIEGSDLKDEYVVIAAHYDHLGLDPALTGDQIYNGAADDASGTASTLELARAFANAKPRRSMLFINFSAEEKGVVGLRYYVTSDPVVLLEQVAAMINLDGVGGIDPKHPSGSRNYAYITTADVPLHDLMAVNERIRNASGIELELTDARGKGFNSDNLSFEAYQVPTLYYSTGLTAHYHTVADEAATLDYEHMARITRLILATAWEVANQDQRPRTIDRSKLTISGYVCPPCAYGCDDVVHEHAGACPVCGMGLAPRYVARD